eukprot:8792716-Alexandrium_andersonii.AAC.1
MAPNNPFPCPTGLGSVSKCLDVRLEWRLQNIEIAANGPNREDYLTKSPTGLSVRCRSEG